MGLLMAGLTLGGKLLLAEEASRNERPAIPVRFEWLATNFVAGGGWGRMIRLENHEWLSVNTRFAGKESMLQLRHAREVPGSWDLAAEVREPGRRMDNGELIELPGGVLWLTGRSLIEGESYHLPVYRSVDAGTTWEYLSEIDTNDGPPGSLDKCGLWEPHFFLLGDGRLAVAYANEKHAGAVPSFSQVCSERISADSGRTWGPEIVLAAEPGGGRLRPGMPVVTRMANGAYLAVYEVVGIDDAQVFRKISGDGEHWPPGLGMRVAGQHAGPWVTSLLNGELLLTSCANRLSCSDDFGITWRFAGPSAWDFGEGTVFTWPAIYEIKANQIAVMVSRNGVKMRLGRLVESGTFQNPINPGPDPYMDFFEGNYYLTTTQGDGIRMWKARTVGGLKTAKPVLIWKDAEPSRAHGIWAPEFHFITNRWYVYYTATSSDDQDENHRMHVLESAGTDPLGPYAYKGRLVNPVNDHYAIDGTVFKNPGDGRWYFLWAAHPGHVLTIARMANPWTLEGVGTVIPAAGFGCSEVREGPQVLAHGDKLFLFYSACDTGKPDYRLGMLMAGTNADLLNSRSWEQYPQPVFERNDAAGVYGPGHNGFFKSPDGTEDWIVYHAKTSEQYTYEGRTTRVQQLTWNADGLPELGKPLPLSAVLKEPAGGAVLGN